MDDVLTGAENLVMLGRLFGLSRPKARDRAAELLDRFDLLAAADRRVASYSGGMRRRLDLAASVIETPEVLFLDEPSTGLDPVSRRALWREIRALADAGTCVFLTTQMLDEAAALADRIPVLRDGRIVADGTVDEVAGAVGRETAVLSGADGDVLRTIDTDGTAGDLAEVLSRLSDVEASARVTLRRPTLDDAFATLIATPAPVDNAADPGSRTVASGQVAS